MIYYYVIIYFIIMELFYYDYYINCYNKHTITITMCVYIYY